MLRLSVKRIMFGILLICLVVVLIELRMLNNVEEEYNSTKVKVSKYKKLFHKYSFMEMVERTRFMIEEQFDDIVNITLKELVPEEGGQPIRCVIFSTWAAGGNLLATMLNAMPGSYYHYEPLSCLTPNRLPSDHKYIDVAIKLLHDLFNCDYSHSGMMDTYLRNVDEYRSIFQANTRLWELCEEDWGYCQSAMPLRSYCRLFPLQLIKTTRLPLAAANELLLLQQQQEQKQQQQQQPPDNENKRHLHKFKIIYMLRDPRGIVHSREQWGRCASNPDNCVDVQRICANMVEDFEAAEELQRHMPDNFMVVKFELLALNMRGYIRKVLRFLGLPYNRYVDKYIQERMALAHSYAARGKNVKQAWQLLWNEPHKSKVEIYCNEALVKWGFERSAVNVTHEPSLNKTR